MRRYGSINVRSAATSCCSSLSLPLVPGVGQSHPPWIGRRRRQERAVVFLSPPSDLAVVENGDGALRVSWDAFFRRTTRCYSARQSKATVVAGGSPVLSRQDGASYVRVLESGLDAIVQR
jgi:hypothetical protein